MECNIIRKSSGFKDLKNDWERIEKTSQNLTYFSTFNYCYTWFKHLNTIDEKLFIVTVIHNDKIVGIAPFHVRNIKGKLLKKRALQFISKGDYSDLLIDENTDIKPSNIISKIFDAIHDNEKEWDEINLTHISQNSLLTHYLLQRKYNKNLEYLVENPFIDFSKYQDYNSYSKEFSPKKIKQYINKFNKSVNYKIILTSENVINSISKIHLAQKTNSNLNNNNNKRHSHFENKEYFDFLTELYSKNRNVLTYLLVDSDKKDEIICYFTGYIFKNKFHSVSTAVNPKYNYLSVGRIFNYLIFKENSYDKKWNIFDMGAGRYEWKFELTNSYKLLYTFHFKNYKTNKMKFLSKIERILSATKHILKN